ncbi:MAG: hypothetical protein JWO98_1432, partial [Frankiales bacterium]|nr:hypothetical protein [Frankiales bacterium]
RAELDAHRAQIAASEERVTRLADVARDTGLLKAAAVAYLVYGPAVLAAAAQPAPWELTAREVAEEDRHYWADREYETETDDD